MTTMPSITHTSLDHTDAADHGALYRGVHDFLRQFVQVAIDLTEANARDRRGFAPAHLDAFRRTMRLH